MSGFTKLPSKLDKNKHKILFVEARKDQYGSLSTLYKVCQILKKSELICVLPNVLGTSVSLLWKLGIRDMDSFVEQIVDISKSSFLTLPLGTIARLCMLLRPKNSMEVYCKNVKLNIHDTEPTEYFLCNKLINPVLLSTGKNNKCRCGSMLAKQISPESSRVFDGFVKNCNGSFLIMDELKVLPNSLDTFYSSAQELWNVLDLLKSCLYSKTALTTFFFGKRFCVKLFKREKIPPCDFETNGSSKINVKIMQRKSNGKILFTQGKEEFADYLFCFHTNPLGGVVHLMIGCSSTGSIDRFYKLVNPGLVPMFKLCNMLLPMMSPNIFVTPNTAHIYRLRACLNTK
uniref:Uncharacterized protein n=1 Tax=Cajanus cajan TaxID=3821 RepID=A0A151U4T2_CAJCA|nr:hypothetical protein KK1_006953 [Cajanus cajan]